MGLSEDLNNPNLFTENKPGDYSYTENSLGKTAKGQLTLDAPKERNSLAQKTVGGDARRTEKNPYGPDDGGHLIGTRFGGSPNEKNLTAQNRNLNRQDYKIMENEWAKLLSEEGTKVYVNVQGYDPGNTGRPQNYQGYYIIERTDAEGHTQRTWETFSFNNESRKTMEDIESKNIDMKDEVDKTAEFHYDEETGELVPNPDYEPEKAEEKSAEQQPNYGVPKAEEESAEENTIENSEEYGVPENGEQPQSKGTDYGVPEKSGEDNAQNTAQTQSNDGHDQDGNAGQNNGGYDMD